jgi:hypothetical protein
VDVKSTVQNPVLVAAERVYGQTNAFLDKGEMIAEHPVGRVRFRLHVERVRTEPIPLIPIQHFCHLVFHKLAPASFGFVVLWRRPFPFEIRRPSVFLGML